MVSISPPICSHCGQKFKMYGVTLKCNVLGCNAQVHEYCADSYRTPCKMNDTQLAAKRNLNEYLNDPLASPKIPSFLYMMLHEVDCRLHEEGIYRNSYL